jgi:hypothetical protein
MIDDERGARRDALGLLARVVGARVVVRRIVVGRGGQLAADAPRIRDDGAIDALGSVLQQPGGHRREVGARHGGIAAAAQEDVARDDAVGVGLGSGQLRAEPPVRAEAHERRRRREHLLV